MKIKKSLKQLAALALIVVLYLGNYYLEGGSGNSDGASTRPNSEASRLPGTDGFAKDDSALIVSSFNAKRSDVWVQASGTVDRVLRDDNDGSRHQRFLVKLGNGHTILIAHNIDLAPKIPLQQGDNVEFRGEYEWNDKGGVVHWTHHDPSGRRAGGWISHQRERYQ